MSGLQNDPFKLAAISLLIHKIIDNERKKKDVNTPVLLFGVTLFFSLILYAYFSDRDRQSDRIIRNETMIVQLQEQSSEALRLINQMQVTQDVVIKKLEAMHDQARRQDN